MRRLCVIDQKPIPAARLEIAPRTKTCRPACAAEHKRNLKRAAARRQYERKLEAKDAAA